MDNLYWYILGQVVLLWVCLSLVVAVPLGLFLKWAKRNGRQPRDS